MDASIFREPRVEALIARGLARSRLSLTTRAERLGDKSWHVVQCSFAAGLAWMIASGVPRHDAPMFAPIVAVVCLGMTYGQRLRRVAEVTVGVALGVALAEGFVTVAGSGAWQISLVVLVAMGIALLLDAGQLLVMQSAVQSIAVTALAQPSGGFNRWVDAVVGGAVALVAATVVPRAPLREPRRVAARVASRIAGLLRDAATSADTGDVEHAAEVLAEARRTDELIRELQAAADEGMAVIASVPWRRTDGVSVRRVAQIVEPLDRALRSTRVLVRRVSIATHHGAQIPTEYAVTLRELAEATDIISRLWAENRMAERARPALVAVAEGTARLEPGEYLTTVLLWQLRSLVVDLLELTGLDHEDAVASVPPVTG
jgi:uncharacterized membrane protein YgaE (UPF0421/DUF939 family)